MSEARKVDSFSLNSRREEEPSLFLLLVLLLLSPVVVGVEEEHGIGLCKIRWRFDEKLSKDEALCVCERVCLRA